MLNINDNYYKKKNCLETINLLSNILNKNLGDEENKCLSSTIKTVAMVLDILYQKDNVLDNINEQFYSFIKIINILVLKLDNSILSNITDDENKENIQNKNNIDNKENLNNHDITFQKIEEKNNLTHLVSCKSFTNDNKSYIINLKDKTCTCPSFYYSHNKKCKHLNSIITDN